MAKLKIVSSREPKNPAQEGLAPEPLPVTQKFAGRPLSSNCVLNAATDREAVNAWLSRVASSKHTFQAYQREADRIYRWAIIAKRKPLSRLTHEDFEEYKLFLSNPQPAELWVSTRKHPRTSNDWRPFCAGLAPVSVRQALVIIDTLFTWLVSACYLEANPLALSGRKGPPPKRTLERYLNVEVIQAVHVYFEEAEQAAKRESDRAYAHLVRCRWVFALCFLTGLRISEVVNGKMGDIKEEVRGDSRLWWIHVVGKGTKARTVPLPDDMLTELKRYRLRQGLSAMPAPSEKTPLVLPLFAGRKQEPLSRFSLHRIIKFIADAAGNYFEMNGLSHVAEHIRKMSAHWLRHSYGTAMADADADLRSVQQNLGHGSLQTTSIYLHVDERRRHTDAAKLTLRK